MDIVTRGQGSEQAPTVVIGYGTWNRGDDAAGLLALESLATLVGDGGDGLVLEPFDRDPITLLDSWSGLERVVVIDAVQSGRPAGDVVVVPSRELDDHHRFQGVSTHGLGLGEAIRLGRVLARLPHCLWIVGIEGERFEVGNAPSIAVRRGAWTAARLVAARWCTMPCTS